MIRRCLLLLLLLGLVAAVPACAAKRRCVPAEIAQCRGWVDLCLPPDAHAPVPPERIMEVAAEFRREATNRHPPGARPYHVLALSGGGFYGSFGIGALTGWSETGTRPEFDVVTGISTGALMATFAFLGPQYDELMRREAVGLDLKQILRRRSVFRIPFAEAVFSSTPMRRRIKEALTPQVLCEVARGHAAGRRIYAGTTNLDTRRLVIWDLGAIAARCTPEAYELYREVVLASCSIPGVFPPVRIPVEIDGVQYEEMHVDGGASDEVIFRPFMVADLNRARGVPGAVAPPSSTLYVINNGKLFADPDCVRPRIMPQVNASFRSILYAKGRDELYRVYLNCLETAIEFRLTSIPDDFRESSPRGSLQVSPDDQERLFAIGREVGHGVPTGAGWRNLPPGTDPNEQALPRAGTRFLTHPVPHE